MMRVAISPRFAAMIFLNGTSGRADSERWCAPEASPGRRSADCVRSTRSILKVLSQTGEQNSAIPIPGVNAALLISYERILHRRPGT